MNLLLPNFSCYEIDDSELLSLELSKSGETLVMALCCPPRGWRRSQWFFNALHAVGVRASKSRDEKVILSYERIGNLTGSFIDTETMMPISTLFNGGRPVLSSVYFRVIKNDVAYGRFEFDDGTIEFEFGRCRQEAFPLDPVQVE